MFEIIRWDGSGATTITGIALAPVDRSGILSMIASRTKWMTDKEVPTFLDWRWNPGSSLLATHDSGRKHSKLWLYRIGPDGKAGSLELPDLLKVAVARLGIREDSVVSSGQMPSRWFRDDLLEVIVNLKTANGRRSVKIPLLVDREGKVSTQ